MRRHQHALNVALFQAAKSNDATQVEALLEQGAEANALEYYTEPDVSLPALWKQCWRRLHGLPVDASADGGSGQSALRVALVEADINDFQDWRVLKLLVDHGARIRAAEDQVGGEPLNRAVYHPSGDTISKEVELVQTLLEAGMDVNGVDDGATPLSVALAKSKSDSRMEIPTLLVDRGADVNAEIGRLPSNQYALLIEATQQRNRAAVAFLAEHGARLDCRDGAGKTPLHWAAYLGELEMVRLLLAKGADLKARDALGHTASMLAQAGNRPDVVAFLKQQGAPDPQAEAPARNAQGQIVLRLPLSWRNGSVPPERLKFTADASGKPPTLTLSEGNRVATLPVGFTPLLGDTDIWSPSEVNSILYQLQRGYYARDGYQLFGLIDSHAHTYLGIRWYSPASSYQETFAVCVFRLDVQGSTLAMTLIRKTGGGEPGSFAMSSASKIPFLSASATGDLLMTSLDGVFALGPADTWRKVDPPPKQP